MQNLNDREKGVANGQFGRKAAEIKVANPNVTAAANRNPIVQAISHWTFTTEALHWRVRFEKGLSPKKTH
jgi:hypothetical protein